MCQAKPKRKPAFKYASLEDKRARLYDMQPAKNKRGLCAVRFCRGHKLKSRRICSRCQHRRRAVNDPIGYAYEIVQTNARRRGKEFTISRAYFRELCEKTDYLLRKGRKIDSLTLDRINPSLGYVKGNVRVVELWLNSSRSMDDPDHDPSGGCPF